MFCKSRERRRVPRARVVSLGLGVAYYGLLLDIDANENHFAFRVERSIAAGPKGSREVEFEFVDEAPAPGFAGFEGFHDGVLGRMKMFGGVLVLGRVAAADVAAFEAQAQVDPGVSHFQALFAAAGVRLDGANLRKMRAARHSCISIKY
jgi:hypothetical protein